MMNLEGTWIMTRTIRVALLATVAVATLCMNVATAAASGSAQMYLTPSATAVAPGQTFTIQQRVTVTGDTVNAVEADLTYTRSAFLTATGQGSPFSTFLNSGGGGLTQYVAGIAGAGLGGDLLIATTTLRAGCTAGSLSLGYGPNAAAISGTTHTDIVTGKIGATVTVGQLNPSVLCLSPSERGQKSTNQKITLFGSGFTTTSTVHFAGSGITVKSVSVPSSTKLVAAIVVAASAITGSRDVAVTTGSNTISCSACFTVMPAPTATSVSPSTVGRGTTTSAQVSGSNFTYRAKVAVSGTGVTATAVTVPSASHVNFTLTVATSAATGTRNITITNPDGGRAVCKACLTIG